MHRRDTRTTALAAGLLLGALALMSTLVPAAALPRPNTDVIGDPAAGAPVDDAPKDVPDGAFEVDDALLRWGINNESNNRAAAPGTFNFFSAGKIGNPGSGGQTLTEASAGAKWSNGKPAGWKATAGKVRIEKLRPNGTYARATWAGTKTDRDGATLGGYATNTKFSDHQVVISGGTGTVDPKTGSATITWKGDFTIIYYSGMSFFYVSDPVLKVSGGVGRLTATLSGFASDMDDSTTWFPVPARTGVVLADLGKVNLRKDLGFTAKPKYLGVTVKGVDQVKQGPYAGSFPQSFINFTKALGINGYWHSTGSAVDKNKPPLSLAVSYAAVDPIIPDPPKTPKDPNPEDPDIDNTAPPPPPDGKPPGDRQQPEPGHHDRPSQAARPSEAAAADTMSPDDVRKAIEELTPVLTVLPAVASPIGGQAHRSPLWIAGALVLLLAVLTVCGPTVYRAVRKDPTEKRDEL